MQVVLFARVHNIRTQWDEQVKKSSHFLVKMITAQTLAKPSTYKDWQIGQDGISREQRALTARAKRVFRTLTPSNNIEDFKPGEILNFSWYEGHEKLKSFANSPTEHRDKKVLK